MKTHVKWNFIFGFACALFVITSCRKDETPATDIGLGYFPVTIGHWVIYEVDSTVYDDFLNDTLVYRYQVKELLESEFTDNEGREAIRVERYRRDYIDSIPYDSISWHLSRVWSFTRTNYIGEKMEENERFIRLAFPVREGVNWNGNLYNTIGSWNYKYKEIDASYALSNMQFDSTVLVEQKREINLLNHRSYYERYAKNVGLIEKNVIDVRDTIVNSVPVLNRIHAGVIYNIKLVDYGPR
jgi:hypothetical protein